MNGAADVGEAESRDATVEGRNERAQKHSEYADEGASGDDRRMLRRAIGRGTEGMADGAQGDVRGRGLSADPRYAHGAPFAELGAPSGGT